MLVTTVKELKELIHHSFSLGLVPKIVGAHGIGKSQIIAQYGKENGYGLIDIRVGQMADAGEILGLAEFIRDPQGNVTDTQFFKPRYLPTNGKWILLLDEINRGTKDILQALFQLVYDKKITLNGYELGSEMRVIALNNPETEDYDTNSFDDCAFMDRFIHFIFKPEVKCWLDYQKGRFPKSHVLNYIRDNNKSLSDQKLKDFTVEVTPSGRSWENVMKVEQYLEEKGLIESNDFFTMVSGLVGDTEAGMFIQDRKNSIRNITPKDITDNFKDCKNYIVKLSDLVSGSPEILANVSSNLNEYLESFEENTITMEVWENVVEYYSITPREHQMAYFKPMLLNISIKGIKGNLDEFVNKNKIVKAFIKTLEKAKGTVKNSNEVENAESL